MDKTFYTFCTNNKYPKSYPKMLAKSLEPYGWRLICFVDSRKDNYPKADNLSLTDVRVLLPEGMQFDFNGWWYKLLLFNNKLFPEKVFYVDIDSIFLRNPDEIEKYVKEKPHHILYAPMDWISDKVATPLMFINHKSNMIQCIWDWFYSQEFHPGVKYRGDQDFVEAALNEFFAGLKEAVWDRWPLHFMGSYKCLFDEGWKRFRGSEEQSKIPENKFITITFNGRPNMTEVVENKKDGWTLFKDYIC